MNSIFSNIFKIHSTTVNSVFTNIFKNHSTTVNSIFTNIFKIHSTTVNSIFSNIIKIHSTTVNSIFSNIIKIHSTVNFILICQLIGVLFMFVEYFNQRLSHPISHYFSNNWGLQIKLPRDQLDSCVHRNDSHLNSSLHSQNRSDLFAASGTPQPERNGRVAVSSQSLAALQATVATRNGHSAAHDGASGTVCSSFLLIHIHFHFFQKAYACSQCCLLLVKKIQFNWMQSSSLGGELVRDMDSNSDVFPLTEPTRASHAALYL